MSASTISRQSHRSEELTTETVDARDTRDVAVHPAASTTQTPPRTARPRDRARLTSAYFQGDFASGQRSIPVDRVAVGTFASRGLARTPVRPHHFQGDFAVGQRTLPLDRLAVGTFATGAVA